LRIVVAPDSFGGTLGPVAAAAAIAAGWRRARPDDELVLLPLSDGGEGLLEALQAGPFADAEVRVADVADAAGLATDATWLLQDDVAVIESAEACGLASLREDRRDPRRTTTWGVGQLLDAAREAGARRILVGLGGSATVDGGAGALSGLGFRLTVADGSGLKVGGEDLPRVTGAARTWVADWDGVRVELLADVRDPLLDAPRVYGPQKGAGPDDVAHLEAGLRALRGVLEGDLGVSRALATAPGAGAAGGLGYGLVAGLGADLRVGATVVAELVGLDAALADADLVLTGEGRLDGTSTAGKVVGAVLERAAARDVPVALVVGQVAADVDSPDVAIEPAAPDGPGENPAAEVADAAARLGGRWGQPVR
jgi:glycerate kinase